MVLHYRVLKQVTSILHVIQKRNSKVQRAKEICCNVVNFNTYQMGIWRMRFDQSELHLNRRRLARQDRSWLALTSSSTSIAYENTSEATTRMLIPSP